MRLRHEIACLCLAAGLVGGLGLTMHLEHRATERACRAPSVSDVLSFTAPVQTACACEGEPVAADVVEPTIEVDGPDDLDDRNGAFAFVLHGDRPLLVIASDVDQAWLEGSPRQLGHSRLEIGVAPSKLPPALARWSQKEVFLYGPEGRVGSGLVGAPKVIVEADGDVWAMASEEEAIAYEAAWDRGEEPSLPPTAILENGRRLLVAPIQTDVDGPVSWARDRELPEPMVLTATRAERGSAARLHLRAHPGTEEVRSAMIDWPNESNPARTPEDLVVVHTWIDDRGQEVAQTAAYVDAYAEACAASYPSFWAMSVLGPEPRALPFADDRRAGPVAVVDLERDGRFEVVLGGDGWDRSVLMTEGPDAGWTTLAELPDVPYFGCPC